jgi:uncharacterized membrane protein
MSAPPSDLSPELITAWSAKLRGAVYLQLTLMWLSVASAVAALIALWSGAMELWYLAPVMATHQALIPLWFIGYSGVRNCHGEALIEWRTWYVVLSGVLAAIAWVVYFLGRAALPQAIESYWPMCVFFGSAFIGHRVAGSMLHAVPSRMQSSPL